MWSPGALGHGPRLPQLFGGFRGTGPKYVTPMPPRTSFTNSLAITIRFLLYFFCSNRWLASEGVGKSRDFGLHFFTFTLAIVCLFKIQRSRVQVA